MSLNQNSAFINRDDPLSNSLWNFVVWKIMPTTEGETSQGSMPCMVLHSYTGLFSHDKWTEYHRECFRCDHGSASLFQPFTQLKNKWGGVKIKIKYRTRWKCEFFWIFISGRRRAWNSSKKFVRHISDNCPIDEFEQSRFKHMLIESIQP